MNSSVRQKLSSSSPNKRKEEFFKPKLQRTLRTGISAEAYCVSYPFLGIFSDCGFWVVVWLLILVFFVFFFFISLKRAGKAENVWSSWRLRLEARKKRETLSSAAKLIFLFYPAVSSVTAVKPSKTKFRSGKILSSL